MITTRSRNHLVQWLTQFGLIVVSTVLPLHLGAAEQDQLPNFVFIMADDLGYADVGANNPDTFYDTVNIDRLAEQGMRFTNAYSASPVCSPTRASVMTGKNPARLGITDYIDQARSNQPENWQRSTAMYPASYIDRLSREEVTMAEALKSAGYSTFFAGKWHLGPEGSWPEDQGFDVNKGGTGQGGPYGGDRYFSPYDNARLEDGPAGEHLPDRLAKETIAFIEKTRDQPFLAFLSFYSVHIPLMARPDLEEKYTLRRRGAPEDAWGQEGDRKVRLVQNNPVYAAMVEALDLAVGDVLDSLKAMGLQDRTVVVLVSDNGGLSTSDGYPTSNNPLRAGKSWLFEGGIRVPLIVKWPGVTRPGSVSGEPVTTDDFYPTVLEMAGLPAQHVDGLSLTPLLHGQATLGREALYWHFPHYGIPGGRPSGAIRQGDWKLIENFEDGRLELYNVADDIGEQTDLAAGNPEMVAELKSLLHAWQTDVDARFPEEMGVFDRWWRKIF